MKPQSHRPDLHVIGKSKIKPANALAIQVYPPYVAGETGDIH
jgi:hypothetical protein